MSRAGTSQARLSQSPRHRPADSAVLVCVHHGDHMRVVTVRDFRDQTFADRRAAAQAGHLRRHRGLVDEDETRSLEYGLIGFQLRPRSGDVRPILLGGVQSFF